MMASENPIWYVGTHPTTQGPKDPLPYDVKVQVMESMMPGICNHVVPHQSWLTLASQIHEKHPGTTLNVYTDEKWVVDTLTKYNGVEGKPHGFYDFHTINCVATPRVSSASRLREAVLQEDRSAFTAAAGFDADAVIVGKPYFDLVEEYLLPLNESHQTDEAAGVGIVTKQNATADVPVGGEYMNVDKIFPQQRSTKKHKKKKSRVRETFDTKVTWRESTTQEGDDLFSAYIDGKRVDLFFEYITAKGIEPFVDIRFTVNHNDDVTGGGSQHKILGAVINKILEYVDENKPKRLTFMASKETDDPNVRSMSRARLYNQLVRKFARNDYEVKILHGEYEDDFQFILKDVDNEKFHDLRDRRK